MNKISFWKTSFGREEIEKIKESILNEHISMGIVTEEFEEKFAKLLNVPYAVATTSGSVALLMACMALNIKKGDEVIVPNRTWISCANAPLILGAKVVLVDCELDKTIVSLKELEKKITNKTKAIMCVHLNGRSVDMKSLKKISKKYNIPLIEDACQALCSKNAQGFLGTQSDIGCFSLGITKLISTGQGGILVTKNKKLYEKLKLIRNNGTFDVFKPSYRLLGCNFKFTDIQAAIGIIQLKKIKERIKHIKKIYKMYEEAIKDMSKIKIIPVDVSNGEVPLYVEVLCENRKKLVNFLKSKNISTREFLPNLNSAEHFKSKGKFPNSDIFEKNGLFLPCGPTQPIKNIKEVIKYLK